MPTHQGQTDQVLKIQLSSFIVAAQWIQDVGAVQGELTLEVRTAYVGNGAPIEVEVRDGDGKTYTQLKGAVHANFFRARFKADKAAGQNRLTFQAKLPKHALQADSGVLPLRPLVEFTQLQWLDAEGKLLDHLTEGQVITLSAQVKGLQEGDIALGRIFSKTQAHGASVDLEADAQVAQGKVQLTWKHVRRVAVKALPNHHQHQQKVITYQPFEYTFEFSAFGVSAKSDPIPLQHTFELTYGLAPGVAGDCEGKKIGVIAPDGKRTDYAIPADGRIVVKDVIAGHYQIDESALDQPEEDTFKPAIDTTQSAAGASSGEG